MENLTLGRFGKHPTYGVTAEETVEKEQRRGEETERSDWILERERKRSMRANTVCFFSVFLCPH